MNNKKHNIYIIFQNITIKKSILIQFFNINKINYEF